MNDMKRAIIVDIDFTLLDSSIPDMLSKLERSRGKSQKYGQDEFHSNLNLCTRNEWCYELIEQMTMNNDLTVLFITGRYETSRDKTIPFLKFSHPVNYELHMKPQDSDKSDTEEKKNILDKLIKKYQIILAIDDRADNCSLFKSYGIPTLKVW